MKNVLLCGLALLALCGCQGVKPGSEKAPDAQPNVPTAIQVSASGEMDLKPETLRQLGLETVTVQNREPGAEILTTGEIKPDENRIFHVNALVSGRILEDRVLLGDAVRQGQTLALLQNLEVAKLQAAYIHELHQNEIEVEKAQARYRLAQRNLQREQRLLSEGISPRKDYYQAQTDAALTRTDLQGSKEHAIHIKAENKALLAAYGLKPGRDSSESIPSSSPITSPRAGVVTRKNITVGDVIDPTSVLYEVADLSQVWLDITLYANDLAHVQPGDAVQFVSDAMPGKVFTGRLNYIPPTASLSGPDQPRNPTATFIARAFLSNPQGLLKPGVFGKVRLKQAQQSPPAPFVPGSALQTLQAGNQQETVVFKVLGPGRFQKQSVTLLQRTPQGALIKSGLTQRDTVVGKGSFSLKAALLQAQNPDTGSD